MKQIILLSHLSQLKKDDKVIMNMEKTKCRLGKNTPDYGTLIFIEPYSVNSGTGHFQTSTGEIITLKANEVIKL